MPEEVISVLLADRWGRRWLRNALDACDAGLLESDSLKAVLIGTQAFMAANGRVKWSDALWQTCAGHSSVGAPAGASFFRLGPATPTDGHVARLWTTLIDEHAWVTHHVRRSLPMGSPVVPFPLARDAGSKSDFDVFVSQADWCEPSRPDGGAWLGRPSSQGASCWVSCDELDKLVNAPRAETQGSVRQVVEALGMEYRKGISWVRYGVDGVELRRTRGVRGRRPVPLDVGNGWFRCTPGGKRGSVFNHSGWGSTVNLGALRHRNRATDGRPEQVLPSIPVDSDFVTSIDCLPAIETDASPVDERFDKMLHKQSSLPKVQGALRRRLKKLWKR